MPEQPVNLQELYEYRRRNYRRSITSAAHVAFLEVLGGNYTSQQQERLAHIALRLDDLDRAAGNIIIRNIIRLPLVPEAEPLEAKQAVLSPEPNQSPDNSGQIESLTKSASFITINIPRTDELKMPEKTDKKLEEPAETSLRDKVKAVLNLLSRMKIDFQEAAVDFPTVQYEGTKKTMPLKTVKKELIKLGYVTKSEIQTNQMDLYALVAMFLLRGSAANLLSGINDGKRVLGTESASRNAIVDEVNNWLVGAWYPEE